MKRRHDEKRIQRNKVPIWMYDELKKQDDDNPTIGIILCADTDEDTKYHLKNYLSGRRDPISL